MERLIDDKSKLKALLKESLIEIIKEEKELFSDLLTEVVEDIAIKNAIKAGENTDPVSRDIIF